MEFPPPHAEKEIVAATTAMSVHDFIPFSMLNAGHGYSNGRVGARVFLFLVVGTDDR